MNFHPTADRSEAKTACIELECQVEVEEAVFDQMHF